MSGTVQNNRTKHTVWSASMIDVPGKVPVECYINNQAPRSLRYLVAVEYDVAVESRERFRFARCYMFPIVLHYTIVCGDVGLIGEQT